MGLKGCLIVVGPRKDYCEWRCAKYVTWQQFACILRQNDVRQNITSFLCFAVRLFHCLQVSKNITYRNVATGYFWSHYSMSFNLTKHEMAQHPALIITSELLTQQEQIKTLTWNMVKNKFTVNYTAAVLSLHTLLRFCANSNHRVILHQLSKLKKKTKH